ncbi:MAG: putative ribonuclease III [Candidatus Berkelbacteria bacterium Licking1014_7]|uniref:Ribonuclease 3 n=1 Tax=Candidatus Berkelbacteria bacterium Licking1014_7 TaxID=2017147 RepID=A0A554LIM1_9BACT|nr:MAG: putative ribonuclease III [Candidatus Berkelbacteria bacterium Licking1014_7]
MTDLKQFQKKINYSFKDLELLETVFIHRSFVNEAKNNGLGHNERLEFLGDAVLELIVTEFLYKNFDNPEGDLTNFRSALVRGDMLSQVAYDLGMLEFMKLSRGERKNTPKSQNLILANAFEALIGAIYLDGRYQAAKKIIKEFLLPRFDEILNQNLFKDSRSEFQEWAQEFEAETPEYRVLEEMGPDHNKMFKVGVYLEGKLFGEGEGSSKQKACQGAATDALSKIKGHK